MKLFWLSLIFCGVVYSQPTANWNWLAPTNHGWDFFDVAYHNGLYFGVTSGGTVLVSSNFTGWTPVDTGVNEVLYGVEVVGSTLVVVGSRGTILTSTDGLNWAKQIASTGHNLYSIATSGSMTVIGGQSVILYSSNLSSWNQVTGLIQDPYLSMQWNGSEFACYGDTRVGISGNGSSWSFHNLGSTLTGLCWDGSKYFASDFTGSVYSSVNALAWTALGTLGTPGASIHYANGALLTALDYRIQRSTDGLTWANVHAFASTNAYSQGVRVLNGTTMVFGSAGMLHTSTDGITWINHRSGYADFNPIESDTNGLVHVAVEPGILGKLMVRSLGISSWTNTGYSGPGLNDVVYDPTKEQFVAVGDFGTIRHSSDGMTWSTETSPSTSDLFAVAHSPIATVIVGKSGTVLTNTGSGYAQQNIGLNFDISSVIWTGSRFVAAGSMLEIMESVDGLTWNPISSGGLQDSVYDMATNGQDIIFATQSGLYSMAPGQLPVLRHSNLTPTKLFWDGFYYVAYGIYGQRSLVSQDGKSWTQMGGPEWFFIRDLITDGELFYGVGSEGRILESYTPYPQGTRYFGPETIPDNDPTGVTSSVNYPSSINYQKIILRVRINHPYLNDLHIRLKNDQSGKEVVVFEGGLMPNATICYVNDMSVVFRDDAPLEASSNCQHRYPGIMGVFRPLNSFASFDPAFDDSQGSWSLIVVDQALFDSGALIEWSIAFESDHLLCDGDALDIDAVSYSEPGASYVFLKDGQSIYESLFPGFSILSADSGHSGLYEVIQYTGALSHKIYSSELKVSPFVKIAPQSSYALGVVPLHLFADNFTCGGTVTWQNLTTNQTWSTNPIFVSPPSTTVYEARVQENTLNATKKVTVLVANHPSFFDLNSDGCNTSLDWEMLCPSWHAARNPDANGDQWIDIRDFPYINTIGSCL